MKVLSLFDGMSCAQIALERASIPVDLYIASEIDKWAIQVTQANYPKTIQLGCAMSLKACDLPQIDLLIGGNRSQAPQLADKTALFYEYVRVLNEFKPRYFLLESVRMKKEWQNIITCMLGVEPIEINSALVSAQNRTRLYWTNIPNVDQPNDLGIVLADILESDGFGVVKKNGLIVRQDQKSVHLDAKYYKGADNRGRRTLIAHAGQDGYRKLTPLECERLQTVPEHYTDHFSDTQRYRMLGKGYTVDILAHIFKRLPKKRS